jgi:hypothetical protein
VERRFIVVLDEPTGLERIVREKRLKPDRRRPPAPRRRPDSLYSLDPALSLYSKRKKSQDDQEKRATRVNRLNIFKRKMDVLSFSQKSYMAEARM